MKKQQLLAFGAWALALARVPSVAQADKPEAGGAKQPDAKPHKPGARPSELFGKPDGKAEPGAKGEHGRGEGKPEAAGADAGGAGAGPKPGHGHEGFRNAMRELHEQLKAGTLKKADLKAQLAKLRENAGERSKEHRQELSKRWGATLAHPAARDELKQHARRMAFLDRAMLLTQTEVTTGKDKVTERITKLIDKENERHEHAMENLKSEPSTPAASAAPAVAAPAAPAVDDAKGAAK